MTLNVTTSTIGIYVWMFSGRYIWGLPQDSVDSHWKPAVYQVDKRVNVYFKHIDSEWSQSTQTKQLKHW